MLCLVVPIRVVVFVDECFRFDLIQFLQHSFLVRRRLRYLQLGRASQHLGESNTDALNNREQNSATNSTVSRSLVATTDGQGATREETGDNGIVRILLLADSLDGAVECRKEATPDAKIAA